MKNIYIYIIHIYIYIYIYIIYSQVSLTRDRYNLSEISNYFHIYLAGDYVYLRNPANSDVYE